MAGTLLALYISLTFPLRLHGLSSGAGIPTARPRLAGPQRSIPNNQYRTLSLQPSTGTREDKVEEKLPPPTIIRPPGRGRGPYHPTVTTEGSPGLVRRTYRVSLRHGVEVGRVMIAEEVLRRPSPRIVTARRGYRLASRGVYAGRRVFAMVATAYDPGPGSCPGTADGITCNGKRAGYGIAAVDPKVIPLGSKLYIEGYGYAIAADVGGAIKGNRIDLGYNSRSGALKWGRKKVLVYVLD